MNSADHGDAPTQNNLGYIDDKGQGVPQNYIQAYRWITLAAAQEYAKAGKGEEILAKKMSHAQLAVAQWLATEWIPKRSE